MIIEMAINQKTVKSSIGEIELEIPQDRKSTFEPKIVKKVKKIFLILIKKLFQCTQKA